MVPAIIPLPFAWPFTCRHVYVRSSGFSTSCSILYLMDLLTSLASTYQAPKPASVSSATHGSAHPARLRTTPAPSRINSICQHLLPPYYLVGRPSMRRFARQALRWRQRGALRSNGCQQTAAQRIDGGRDFSTTATKPASCHVARSPPTAYSLGASTIAYSPSVLHT